MIDNCEWIYGIWFCGDGHSQDWMGRLFKRAGHWVFEYRFRYYGKNHRAFDSDDKKHWYTARADKPSDGTRAKFLDLVNKGLAIIETMMGKPHDFVLLDCKPDDPKVLFELGSRPWAHIKMVKRDKL